VGTSYVKPPKSQAAATYSKVMNIHNLTGYSVQEDATPLDGSSTEGGVGTISFGLPETDTSLALFGTDIEVDDDFRGMTSGTITEVSLSNGINTVTADSRLGILVGSATAKPMTGNFEAVARAYLRLGGIVDGVYFDPRIGGMQVTAPGWNDDVWLKLKQLCIAHRVEIAVVATNIVFRPARSVTLDVRKKTDFTVSVAKTDSARSVEVTRYSNEWVDGEVVYPRNATEIAAAQVYTVEAGAVLEDDITLSASVASVLQPICVDDVAQDYDGTQSVYSVRASDNSQVTAQDWTSLGGKVELSINPDTTSVHIKITASSDQYYGPYRIAGRMKEVVDPNTVIVGPGQQADIAASTSSTSSAGTSKTSSSTKTTVLDPVASNDYPWAKATIKTLSPLGYDYRECVDFVAWRLNRDAGVKHAPWKYTWGNLRITNGNAIGWKADWQKHGWKVNITPYPGCIAWFGTSAGAQGHVAYVQHVTATEVVLEDYNWGGTHIYHKHTMKRSSVDSFLEPPSGKPATKTVTTTGSSSTKTGTVTTTTTANGTTTVVSATPDDAPENNPADSETDYNSLRIVGTGTIIDKTILVLPTGMAAGHTVADVGVTVENIFVSTVDDAYRVGSYVATRFKGEEQTISGTLTSINQRSGSGTLLGPQISDFDAEYKGMTIAQFNAQWSGKTMADFKATQTAKVIDTADNQVFGNVAGARFKYKDAMYRVTTSTVSNSAIEFSATRDTMIADFNAAHAGKTIADFNTQFAGLSLKQFGRMPLQGG
jgi:surface antigen